MALSAVPKTADTFPTFQKGSRVIRRTVPHGSMMYHCEATTLTGFIQQLAVAYLTHGYYFYVTGRVPEGKCPLALDRKLIARYGVDISKWARMRRKREGMANVQYLRHGRFFVLLATHGQHDFFALEKNALRDARRTPVRYGGYAVSVRGGHAHVRIDQPEYLRLKAFLVQRGLHTRAERMAAALNRIPFEPYAPARRQLLNILRAVNRARRGRGFDAVPFEALRLRRRIVRPFCLIEEGVCSASIDGINDNPVPTRSASDGRRDQPIPRHEHLSSLSPDF